jgi:hypothetical protein
MRSQRGQKKKDKTGFGRALLKSHEQFVKHKIRYVSAMTQ